MIEKMGVVEVAASTAFATLAVDIESLIAEDSKLVDAGDSDSVAIVVDIGFVALAEGNQGIVDHTRVWVEHNHTLYDDQLKRLINKDAMITSLAHHWLSGGSQLFILAHGSKKVSVHVFQFSYSSCQLRRSRLILAYLCDPSPC